MKEIAKRVIAHRSQGRVTRPFVEQWTALEIRLIVHRFREPYPEFEVVDLLMTRDLA